MKKTIILFQFLIAILTSALSQNFSIIGKIDKTSGYVYLVTFTGEKFSKIDSTIITQGRFSFEGKCDTTYLAVVSCGNYPDSVISTRLILESGNIEVLLGKTSKIGGTQLNNLYQSHLVLYNEINDSLNFVLNSMSNSSFSNVQVAKMKNRLNDLRFNFIKQNINNFIGRNLFNEHRLYCSEKQFDEIYASADSTFKLDPENKRFALWVKNRFAEFKTKSNNFTRLSGQKFTDNTFLLENRKEVKLSDFIGKSKYVLLDFWATWCGPCMSEMSSIRNLYVKYKDLGLNVIGISLDTNFNIWKKSIQDNDFIWTQLKVNNNETELKSAYDFSGIPYTVLIDQNGKIVATGFRGGMLDGIISKLLNDK